jgi:hypothetical protein
LEGEEKAGKSEIALVDFTVSCSNEWSGRSSGDALLLNWEESRAASKVEEAVHT